MLVYAVRNRLEPGCFAPENSFKLVPSGFVTFIWWHIKKEKIWLRLNYRLSSIRLDTGVELAIVEVVISLNFEISLFFLKFQILGCVRHSVSILL